MNRARLSLPLGVAGLAAVAAFGLSIDPAAPVSSPLRTAQRAVDSLTLVCPDVAGTAHGLRTTMTVTDADALMGSPRPVTIGFVPLTGRRMRPTMVPAVPATTITKTGAFGAVAVTATGPGAAAIAADQVGIQETGRGRGVSDMACAPPATDWWFVGADGRVGRSDTLFLVNPSDELANVAVGIWSAKGPLSPPHASSIPVAGRSSALVRISDLAPDSGDLMVHVHANAGSVMASVFDVRTTGVNPLGVDWLPSSGGPAVSSVVAGFVPGPGGRYVLLGNPARRDATATLRVITRTGNFQPAGHQSIVVPAGRTISFDLGAPLGGEAGSVVVDSDLPIVAEGVSIAFVEHHYEEVAWHPAQPAITGPVVLPANAPPLGQVTTLQLTAPAGATRVRLVASGGVTRDVAVPAGRTLQVDLKAALHFGGDGPGPVLIEPLTSQPLYASRLLFAQGAHGPLTATEVPIPLPRPLVVPPVVEDLRAAFL